MYNEEKGKGKDKEKCCEGEAKGEQIKKLNDGLLTSQQIDKWSVCMVWTQMTS